jgi:hypothetical protein
LPGENEPLAHEDHVFDESSYDGADAAQYYASTPNHEEGVHAEQTSLIPEHQQEAASEAPIAAEKSHSPEHEEPIHEYEVETEASRDVAPEPSMEENNKQGSEQRIQQSQPEEPSEHSMPAPVNPGSHKDNAHHESVLEPELVHEEEKSIDSTPTIEAQSEDHGSSPASGAVATASQVDDPVGSSALVRDEDYSIAKGPGAEDTTQHGYDGGNEVLDNEPKIHEEVQEPASFEASSRPEQPTEHSACDESNESAKQQESQQEPPPGAAHQIPDSASSAVDKNGETEHPSVEDSGSEGYEVFVSAKVETPHLSGTDREAELAEKDDHDQNLDKSAVEELEGRKGHEDPLEPQSKSAEGTEGSEATETEPPYETGTSAEYSDVVLPEGYVHQFSPSALTATESEELQQPAEDDITAGEIGESNHSREHTAPVHAAQDPAHQEDETSSTALVEDKDHQGPGEADQQLNQRTNIQDAALHHNDESASNDTDHREPHDVDEQNPHKQGTESHIEQPTKVEAASDRQPETERSIPNPQEESTSEEQLSLAPLVNIPEDHPAEDFTVFEAEKNPSSAQLRESFSHDESLTQWNTVRKLTLMSSSLTMHTIMTHPPKVYLGTNS